MFLGHFQIRLEEITNLMKKAIEEKKALEAEVSRLREENEKLKSEKGSLLFSIEAWKEQHKKDLATINDYREENEKLKMEPGINVSEVLQEICALKAELDVTVEENKKLKDRLRQSCTSCEKKIAIENDELRARIAELESGTVDVDHEERISKLEKYLGTQSKY